MNHLVMILACLFVMGTVGFVSVIVGEPMVSSDLVQERLDLKTYGAPVLYDSGSHPLCYYNFSYDGIGEWGYVAVSTVPFNENVVYWKNSTSLLTGASYRIYREVGGKAPIVPSDIVDGVIPEYKYAEYWRSLYNSPNNDYVDNFVNLLVGSFSAIMVSMAAAAAVVALNIFSSGLNAYGTRSLMTIMFFSLLWALVSAIGGGTLTAIPVIGWLIYLLMTFAYFLGVWGEINSGGTS